MDSRTRVLTALSGEAPDKVPVALGFSGPDLASLAPAGEAERYRVDVRFVSFRPSPEQEQFERFVEALPRDTRIGGQALLRTYAEWGYQPDVTEVNPLAQARTPADLDAYAWPDTSAPYRYEGMAADVAAYHERGLAVAGNLPHLGGELFETGWRLRGFQNWNLDLLERPELADSLLDRLAAMSSRNAATVAASGVDVLVLDDDVGMPEHMIISPELWCRFLQPRLARVIAAAREVKPDIRVLYHSDGVITPIIGELLAIGVDAINPVQPDRMDGVAIRRAFGTRPALWGTVGTHAALAYGTLDTIRAEVRRRIQELGRAGLVLAPAYDLDEPDVPWPNLRAFLEAAEEFG
jgi:uroporphyrinogen decarboxylase